jgi:hypothetical protein
LGDRWFVAVGSRKPGLETASRADSSNTVKLTSAMQRPRRLPTRLMVSPPPKSKVYSRSFSLTAEGTSKGLGRPWHSLSVLSDVLKLSDVPPTCQHHPMHVFWLGPHDLIRLPNGTQFGCHGGPLDHHCVQPLSLTNSLDVLDPGRSYNVHSFLREVAKDVSDLPRSGPPPHTRRNRNRLIQTGCF